MNKYRSIFSKISLGLWSLIDLIAESHCTWRWESLPGNEESWPNNSISVVTVGGSASLGTPCTQANLSLNGWVEGWMDLERWNSLRLHGLYSPWNSSGQDMGGWLFSSPGDLPDPGIEPGSSALQADSLPAELPGRSGSVVITAGTYRALLNISQRESEPLSFSSRISSS